MLPSSLSINDKVSSSNRGSISSKVWVSRKAWLIRAIASSSSPRRLRSVMLLIKPCQCNWVPCPVENRHRLVSEPDHATVACDHPELHVE